MASEDRNVGEFSEWFPLNYSNSVTGVTECYEKPFDLWSDYEHFDSRNELKPHESFSDKFGRQVEFKTTVQGFIESIYNA